MGIYNAFAVLLFIVGFFIIFNVNVLELTIGTVSRLYTKRKGRIKTDTELKREFLVGESISFYERKKLEVNAILKYNKSLSNFNTFIRNAFIIGVAGFMFGAVLQNILLALVLFFGLGSIPFMVLILKRDKYLNMINDKLEVALSAITATYIQNSDISKSVSLVIERIPPPITEIFKEFVVETKFINSNIKKAINRMKQKIDNPYFRRWCDTLIQCQDDTMIRFVLPSIIEQMSDSKKLQAESETVISGIYKEYSTMVFIEFIFVPMLYFMQKEWFFVLFNTFLGKAVLAVNVAVVLLGYVYIIKINRPISLM